jgi:RimJ/RimL family protein N-acetyltransferase
MFLKSMKILLRPLESADLPALSNWMNTPEFAQSMLRVWPMNAANAAAWYEGKCNSLHTLAFAMDSLVTSTLIGITALQNVHWVHRVAECWIGIGDQSQRGRGSGTEALQLLTGYAFGQLGLRKLYLHVAGTNLAAIAVYNKIGFVREVVHEREMYIDGRYIDVWRMALFNPE